MSSTCCLAIFPKSLPLLSQGEKRGKIMADATFTLSFIVMDLMDIHLKA